MKGIAEGIYLVMQMVLIVILLGLILYLLSIVPSNEQVARLNVELLRSKIHEACTHPGSEVTLESFSLQQVKPSKIVLWNLLAAYRIKTLGDPDFLLYYEAFPVGEGLSWEVYQSTALGYRIFAPITIVGKDQPGDALTGEEFENLLYRQDASAYKTTLEKVAAKKLEVREQKFQVLIPNIMLSDYVNVLPTTETKPLTPTLKKSKNQKGDAGYWIDGATLDAQDVYKLEFMPSEIEKSFVKYRPCGVNSLCLKTPETVTRIPITGCGDNLQYILLSYDVSDKNKVATGLVTAGVLVGGAAVAWSWSALLGAAPAATGFGMVSGTGLAGPTVLRTFLTGGKWILKLGGKLLWRIVNMPWIGPIVGGKIIGETYEKLKGAAALLIIAFASIKTSDFYVASPCTLEDVKIKRVECSALYPARDRNKFLDSGPGKCERWMKYPIYSVTVDENDVKRAKVEGTHYQCVEGLGPPGGVPDCDCEATAPASITTSDVIRSNPIGVCTAGCNDNTVTNEGKQCMVNEPQTCEEGLRIVKPDERPPPTGTCLVITVRKPAKDFCWTRNAYREGWRSWLYNDLGNLAELNTVVEKTEFIDSGTILVRPFDNPLATSSARELFGFEWKWPGAMSVP